MNHLPELLTVIALAALYTHARSIGRSNAHLRAELARYAQNVELLDSRFGALMSCSRRIGDRFSEVERHDRSLQKQIDTLKLGHDDGQVAIEHAMKLLANGSQMEDVTNICDLTQGEVEILRNLTQFRSAA